MQGVGGRGSQSLSGVKTGALCDWSKPVREAREEGQIAIVPGTLHLTPDRCRKCPLAETRGGSRKPSPPRGVCTGPGFVHPTGFLPSHSRGVWS